MHSRSSQRIPSRKPPRFWPQETKDGAPKIFWLYRQAFANSIGAKSFTPKYAETKQRNASVQLKYFANHEKNFI